MDPEVQPPKVNKSLSSLPRPAGLSRLPVLRSKNSQISLTDASEVPRPSSTTGTPRVQKRTSIPSFSRLAQPPPKANGPSSRPSASRSIPTSSKHVSEVITGTTGSRASSIGRPNSRANQQKLSQLVSKSPTNPEDGENQDRLSSLDSFRSASRQGLHDDQLREPQEDIEPTDPELDAVPKARKSSRPSLSDRTIESLSNVPSTPKERRRSSFFSPVESPMGPPPRPSSSMSRNGSNGSSRPGTSDGSFSRPLARPSSAAKKAPSSAKPALRSSAHGFGFTPNANRRSVSSSLTSKLYASKESVPSSLRSPSPTKKVASNGPPAQKAALASKTVGTRPSKPRPSLSDAFGPAVRKGAMQDGSGEESALTAQTPSPKVSKRVVSNPSNASSSALRQQIAAAKSAARKDKAKVDSPQDSAISNGSSFDFDMHADPFNQIPRDEKHVLRNRINTARMDGRLNIAGLGLKNFPDEVMKMYDAAAMEESKVNWAEVVDLTRLIAADNEFEEMDAAVFPDKSSEDFDQDDQSEGNQFGGLEVLDLHGNRLQVLPIGLRRLERLTTLNLAYNKLENDALGVISQIASLKDLRLGHNSLSGSLPTSLCDLRNLENLDLQSNRLLGLPEALRELTSLRVFNVSGNQLTALPMEALKAMSLTELDASSNALIGSLFPVGVDTTHSTLQSLKAANNSLAALTFSDVVDLPQLRTLDLTNNHLTSLPPIANWKELITLTVGDNKITELPSGFCTLRKLRNVNLTSNEVRLLDPEISGMDSLESLILAANPLRDKKFLTMNAADIKRDLKARRGPESIRSVDSPDHESYHDARDCVSPTLSSPSSSWALQPHGTLDLGGRGYGDDINDSLGSFLKSNEVKNMHLQANMFTAIPPALWLGQELRVLDLSGNALGRDYLSDELSLPTLQELNISRCSITALEPLMTQLIAPRLQTLNLTANRLAGALPTLRNSYPILSTLLAGDNKLTEVTAVSLRGLHTANLASNNIEHLPAEIGLLWDHGLRSLEVGLNAFRVPNYRVLERGTEATLRSLRNKLPASSGDASEGHGFD